MEEPKLIEKDNLRLIVFSSARELGDKVNKHTLSLSIMTELEDII